MLARFRREAQAAGSLDSNHVVGVVDFGVEGGLPYMVMEFLKGQDLRILIAQTGRLAVERAVDFAIQTCHGLAAAHANDIVHRDLKPENIFITQRNGAESVKILDFGIAKLRGKVASGLTTKPGSILGTLYYMPPEQVRGDHTVDQRADIYALGAILYECLTNQVPHPGMEPQTILYHIMHQPIVRLDTLRQDLPQGLAWVVHKALAYEPSDRYGTAEEFGSRLSPFTGRSPTPFDIREPASDDPLYSDLVDRTKSFQPTEPDLRHTSVEPTASSVGHGGSRQLLKSTYARAGALILVFVLIASIAVIFGRMASETSRNALLLPVVPATYSAMRSMTFDVSIVVSPAYATLTLDGKRVGIGSYKATLPVDGREHTLQLEAAGFIPQTIAFMDRLPLRHVALVKLTAATPSAGAASPGARKVASRSVPKPHETPRSSSSAGRSDEDVLANPYGERPAPTALTSSRVDAPARKVVLPALPQPRKVAPPSRSSAPSNQDFFENPYPERARPTPNHAPMH